jgi:hypothetical protein
MHDENGKQHKKKLHSSNISQKESPAKEEASQFNHFFPMNYNYIKPLNASLQL